MNSLPASPLASFSFFRQLMHLPKSLVLGLLALGSCNQSTSFNREAWVDHPAVTDTHNPRARMVQDLISNHLKVGMTRKAVVVQLGQPYKEGIERRLPKNTILPDSISATNPENLKPENEKRSVAGLNKFIDLYAAPIMVMRYPVGWSTIDPNFLIIKLDKNGLVEDYWIEQS
jgi:hypothetical protein